MNILRFPRSAVNRDLRVVLKFEAPFSLV